VNCKYHIRPVYRLKVNLLAYDGSPSNHLDLSSQCVDREKEVGEDLKYDEVERNPDRVAPFIALP
jgi:hypothetical protein